jgi:hypothetical protein
MRINIYIYVYTYIHIYIHTYTHKYIHIQMYTSKNTYTTEFHKRGAQRPGETEKNPRKKNFKFGSFYEAKDGQRR